MKHYGDITKLNGAELPAVDVITGGSPCQDLSVAGKRAGLAGERSGLFMEQIRVIKEMRQHDRDSGRAGKFIRPRYMVWENVPGAFSSNSGEDFRAVLEETANIADENAVVPQPPNGKWTTSGAIMGDGWSIAWRVLDAQFWGVPQRRRRIALVADFGGHTAPEILFERDGVSGDIEESGTTGERIAADAESGTAYAIRMREGCAGGGKGPLIQEEKSGTLGTSNDQTICYGICSYASNSMKSDNPHSGIYKANTARTLDLNGGNPACNQGGIIALDACEPTTYPGVGITSKQNASKGTPGVCHTLNQDSRNYVCYDMTHASDVIRECGETAPTLQSRMGTGGNQIPLTFGIGNGQADNTRLTPIADTLNCMHDQQAVMIAAVDCRNGTENPDVNGTLQAKEQGQNLNSNNVVRSNMTVRRLTPLECERLQGYPDGWTDIGEWTDSKGKVHKPSDSARYKALGNSIALPPWHWVLLRITAQYERPATLGSLFDGIGGFPLIWERLNGDGTCLWASEIEEFCIAVTRLRFERTEQV